MTVSPYLHVVRPGHDPVLPRHKLCRPHRQVAHLDGLDGALDLTRTGLVAPDVDVSVVEGHQDPRLGRVEVNRLHTVGPGRQHALDVKS